MSVGTQATVIEDFRVVVPPGLSSPARTLASWVRIPLKTWMFVCVYSVFVLGSCFSTG
jgi:hypothetical protein